MPFEDSQWLESFLGDPPLKNQVFNWAGADRIFAIPLDQVLPFPQSAIKKSALGFLRCDDYGKLYATKR